MKKIILHVCMLLAVVTAAAAEKELTVYREGPYELLIRSRFSPTRDLVIGIHRFVNDNAWLLDRNIPLSQLRTKGECIHVGGDDYPAMTIEKYGNLSGNHGSFFARFLKIPGHGLTQSDLGGVLQEKDGYSYCIVGIRDADTLLIHPEGKIGAADPGYRHHSKAPLFYKGKPLPFQSSSLVQMHPGNRITEYEFLADGKEIPEKEEIRCNEVELRFTHDVVSPAAIVQWYKNHPGKQLNPPVIGGSWKMLPVHTEELRKLSPEYMNLAAILTVKERFVFQPGGFVKYRTVKFLQDLKGISNMDLTFCWDGTISKKKSDEFYIPKLKPLKAKGFSGAPDIPCDFTNIMKMPQTMSVNYLINNANCIDKKELPDRFIRLVGDDSREIGVVLGSSLVNGYTAKKDRWFQYYLWGTKKMYPYTMILRDIKAGQTEETVSYKQYFYPPADPDLTAFYWHKEGDSTLVYMDFHKKMVGKKVVLPASFAGKKISVVEKTAGVTLHAGTGVPDGGIVFDAAENRGFLVLKLD